MWKKRSEWKREIKEKRMTWWCSLWLQDQLSTLGSKEGDMYMERRWYEREMRVQWVEKSHTKSSNTKWWQETESPDKDWSWRIEHGNVAYMFTKWLRGYKVLSIMAWDAETVHPQRPSYWSSHTLKQGCWGLFFHYGLGDENMTQQ